MKNLFGSWALAVNCFVTALPAAAAPITVYLTPSALTVGTGSTFSVDVMVSGLVIRDNVSGFDLNLVFNGGIVSGTGATENGALFGLSAFGPATLGANDLGLEGTSFETDADLIALQNPASAAVVPDFRIARFDFLAGAANGSTRIDFGTVVPFESNVLGLLDPNLQATTHDAVFLGACIVVGTQGGDCIRPVSEPSTAPLVGLALTGVWFARLRRPKVS